MGSICEGNQIDGAPIVRLESAFLQADVAPQIGGRVVNLVEKRSGRQLLWHNPHLKLERCAPGSAYDPNFYGAIDELLPNDVPEPFNGVDNPDHGELWTTELDYRIPHGMLSLSGLLPLAGLRYERRMRLRDDAPELVLDYRIENVSGERRIFLWKLHAALAIQAGDTILCPARTARVVDPQYSRWARLEPFAWPYIEGNKPVNVVPPLDGTMDFLFIYDLRAGSLSWRSGSSDLTFEYRFDPAVFPYAWYFASYGGFDGHYMAILEPCTTMPLSVNEAAPLGQCSVLEAGQTLETSITIYAGPATA
jgi:hypothetical protein